MRDSLHDLPGAEPFDAEVTAALLAAQRSRGLGYRPRTHYLEPDGSPRYVNRLALETSPYLLQHAHNPVDWRPWGEEAFASAERLRRPILLSVGYSTCHWCHVMEEESFEDEEIAAYINSAYVAIKVDREERPDVDAVYMSAIQLLSGSGGWPMTVVMGPDRRPFFGGTYFPPRDGQRGGRIGFLTILQRLREAYERRPEDVARSAEQVTAALREGARGRAGREAPGPEALVGAAVALARRFDPEWGGFGGAPKFPRPSTLELALRYARRTGDEGATHMVVTTLHAMRNGGIYDQIGGGFHRYSTDDEWLVPHFEKMAYDNAQLVAIYLEGYQATGEPRFAATARDTLDYVARALASPEGGFYSATDADSEGHEGRFFVWTPDELASVLGPDRAQVVARHFGVTRPGNFEGRSVLHLQPGREPSLEDRRILDEVRPLLLAARERRPRPLLDDKIITEWNGQLVSAHARAGFVLDEPSYLERARRAARFLLEHLRTSDGFLHRTHRAGSAKHAGVLEDYSFFVAGLLDLFEATGEGEWLTAALALQEHQDAEFLDPAEGAYFGTALHAEALLVREKPSYDGAQPSGNAVAALNLLRLHELTGEARWARQAEGIFVALAEVLQRGALAGPKLATALDFFHDTPLQIVLVAPRGGSAAPLTDVVRKAFVPNRVLVQVEEGSDLAARLPIAAGKVALGGRPTAYVCVAQACQTPCSEPAELKAQLGRFRPLPAPPDGLRVPRSPGRMGVSG